MAELEPVVRPNGRLYRPRRLRAFFCEDDYTGQAEVLVLGTHTQAAALPLAFAEANYRLADGSLDAVPSPGWWRDGFECGERAWIYDDVRGAAGLRFVIT